MTNLQRRFEILLPQRFNDGQSVPDQLFADTPENQSYFREFKERLKARFEQLDIRMTTYVIEAF